FVANALAPAKVKEVHVDRDSGTATVIVPDYQLSLAIGKEGQNARLAAKLTGCRIDIKSETQAAEDDRQRREARRPEPPSRSQAEPEPSASKQAEPEPAPANDSVAPHSDGEAAAPVEEAMPQPVAESEASASA